MEAPIDEILKVTIKRSTEKEVLLAGHHNIARLPITPIKSGYTVTKRRRKKNASKS
ncbi:MAG: hypothetical protein WCE81_06155 [Halobacteriota archaeon]